MDFGISRIYCDELRTVNLVRIKFRFPIYFLEFLYKQTVTVSHCSHCCREKITKSFRLCNSSHCMFAAEVAKSQ